MKYLSISDFLSKLKGGNIDFNDYIDEIFNLEYNEPVTQEFITKEIFESFNKQIMDE